MTAPIVGITSTPRLTTYMTVDMFAKHSRRGVAIDRLMPGARQADQLGQLAEFIDEASNWVDHICQQILTATQDTVMSRVNVDHNGYATIHPRYRPVVAVTAFALGPTPTNLQVFPSLAAIGVTRDSFTVPAWGSVLPVSTSAGPLQLGNGAGSYSDRAWTQYTYVNGYPVTSLTANVAVGDVVVQVADTTGIIAGNTWLTIYTDPGKRSRFLAGAVSTTSGPGTVTCPAQTYAINVNDPYPTQISALPSSVISACALATRALIKDANPGAASNDSSTTPDDDYAEAAALLRDFVAPIA